MSGEANVRGYRELMAKLERPEWVEQPASNFLDRWRFAGEREAKKLAPRWRGHLRRSITSERDKARFPKWARIGTNLPYAKPVEFGTGLLSDAPDSKHRRYFPPPAALDAWAIAHGFHTGSATKARASVGLIPPKPGEETTHPGSYGVLVSQIIFKRGGTHPRRFLRGGAEKANANIPRYLANMADEIEKLAEAG